MSNSYCVFAMLYDELTENVEYEVRSDYISGFLNTKGINSGNMLDLACGTGSFGECFANRGFDVVGVDLSEEMLIHAKSKLGDGNVVQASMTEYENENQYDAIICMLDSINHLESKADVQLTFDKCYKNLNQGGVFIFDVNTIYKHQEVLADSTFVFDEDEFYLVWDNELLNKRTVRVILDMFISNEDGYYTRINEEFCEIAYTNDEIIEMLNNAGFNKIEYHNSPFDCDNGECERIYFVCEK